MRLPACVAFCAPLALLVGLGGFFPAAGAAPGEADKALPDRPRILFDRGAVLAEQGDTARAEALFEKVIAMSDQEIATRAHYNLGCLAAEKARALFGERPEEAPPDVRKQGMDLLDRAAAQFRDCLRLDPGHADARHNLEIIRLFAARMRKAWRDRDRPQPPPPAPEKRPHGKQAAKRPPKKGPGEKAGKHDDSGSLPGSAESQKPPAPDDHPKAPSEVEGPPPKPSTVPETDPARQLVQKLIDRVRKRSLEKRQWDKQRQPRSWTQVDEKNW
jgi:tetratricopeptide (TPR) repeat protein